MHLFQVKLSVKALAEFLYQHGDLTSAFLSSERANLGSRIHRLLQKRGGDAYQSEVFLKETTDYQEIRFVIDGRADGIIQEENSVVVDEIKTTAIDFTAIHEDMNFTHWAQAYGYAYLYANQHEQMDMIIQLTYYQIDTDEIKQFRRHKTFVELRDFYLGMLEQYYQWAMRSHNFQTLRDASLRALAFPFSSYRSGQREMAIAVYKTILDEDVMFAQAPTGIGKTISVLFPALKALGEGKLERIFYLSAKTITANVAKHTMKQMLDQGLHCKVVALTAKEKMCLMDEKNCDPDVCPYAKGYYDRLRPALMALLEEHDFMDQPLFQEYGKTHQLCPFELSLDSALSADVIICDYNYVFDPRVYLKRFFSEPSDHILLIDEAHNMVDRARTMYSAQLKRSRIQELYRLLDPDSKVCRRLTRKLSTALKQAGAACDERGFMAYHEPNNDLLQIIAQLHKELDRYLQQEHENNDEITTLFFELLGYERIAELYDEHFITWVKQEGKDVTIKQFCLNPARSLTKMIQMGKAAVYFSATLSPIRYFTDLLLEGECRKKLALPSPFDPKRCKLLIHRGIDTRYQHRFASIEPIIRTIDTAIHEKIGNYIVFFPSYAYLKQTAECFKQHYPDTHLEIQDADMDETQKQAFLDLFQAQAESMVCFCVLGGMFAEGIDFKGEALIGVMIVGVGLPQINAESDLLRDYFEQAYGKGYAYAYQYPGMNKVLQAAGRLIRDRSDYGFILFMDDRYLSAQYRPLFPLHMRHYECIDNEVQLKETLHQFWKEYL
ncbi:MAG: ATP-dependent DNA helicase [Erysipelotrichaceae bacterium]|nr:ATP-dependent DNA helicase [Erysipelotrichaceae bacterium]